MSAPPQDESSPLYRYKLLRQLARDALATTWVAHAPDHPGELFELVQIDPRVAHEAAHRESFLAEAAALAAVPHPGVLAFSLYGWEHDVLFGVRPHHHAVTLDDLLEAVARGRGGQELSAAVTARIGVELCSALRGLHGTAPSPTVHRDLTPRHILLLTDGSLIVLHSGLGLAASKAGVGRSCNERLAYKAPEQLGGRDADPRSDVFACGAVLYEALNGERLFGGETDAEIAGELSGRDYPQVERLRETALPGLGPVLVRALSPDPAERQRHAGELLDALRGVGGVAPVAELARVVQRWSAATLQQRRHQLAEAMAGGGVPSSRGSSSPSLGQRSPGPPGVKSGGLAGPLPSSSPAPPRRSPAATPPAGTHASGVTPRAPRSPVRTPLPPPTPSAPPHASLRVPPARSVQAAAGPTMPSPGSARAVPAFPALPPPAPLPGAAYSPGRRETSEWYGGRPLAQSRRASQGVASEPPHRGAPSPARGERIRRLGSDIGFAEQAAAARDSFAPEEDAGTAERGLRPGMIVSGKFALVRLIAEGGIGAVFEAEDTLVGRRVALKVLRPQYARHGDLVRRFRREAHATARVEHTNVVTVYEMGRRRDGTFFIAQELLHGPNLAELLYERRRLPVGEALGALVPIMGALVAAHTVGIVHRDLKPSNIVLARTSSGETVPKLIDFGAARLRARRRGETHIGTLVGTPHYMSPEQALGESSVDGRADVWSMGVVLYELLSGRCPYDGPNEHAILAKITTEEPPRLADAMPDAPPELCGILEAALCFDVAQRIDMATFRRRLAAFAGRPGSPFASLAPPAVGVPGVSPTVAPRAETDELLRVSRFEDAEDEDAFDDDDGPQPMGGGAQGGGFMRGTTGTEAEYAEDAAPQGMLERHVEEAQQSLSINALDEAVRHAAAAIGLAEGDAEVIGRMRLVQAIAARWLGHYPDTEAYALEAAHSMQRGSTGWYAAVGHVAIARGYLGKATALSDLAQELSALEARDHVSAAHVIAACRLAVFLVRAGSVDLAEELVSNAHRLVDRQEAAQAVVHAWLDVALAEFAVHEGDATTYLRRVESAAERFTSAGDVRNACLQRANVGNAYMHFGAWDHAGVVLRQALALAEPMKLDFVGTMKANLGYALCRLGSVDAALEIETEALEQCIGTGNRRLECFTRVYIAFTHWARGELDLAAQQLRLAVERTEGLPSLRAYALAALAATLLREGRAHDALPPAGQAMVMFERLGGAEEGEALIRLADAMALYQTGQVGEAATRMVTAKNRLLMRADRISDPRWRESFLRNVPENARTLELAAAWAGEGT